MWVVRGGTRRYSTVAQVGDTGRGVARTLRLLHAAQIGVTSAPLAASNGAPKPGTRSLPLGYLSDRTRSLPLPYLSDRTRSLPLRYLSDRAALRRYLAVGARAARALGPVPRP